MFKLTVTRKGYSTELDREIERLVGKPCDGAGIDLRTGIRDMEFNFKDGKAAEIARNKLQKIKVKVDLETGSNRASRAKR